jgi:fatty acid desaturase
MNRGIAPVAKPPRDLRMGGSSLNEEFCGNARPDEKHAQANSDDRRLYVQLREELAAAGCFAASQRKTALKRIWVSALAAAAYGGLLAGPHWMMRIVLCALYGFAAVQGGFIAHEIGHRAAMRKDRWSAIFARFFMTVIGGVAFAYFWDRHRSHHLHANVFASDPDIQCAGSSVCPESVATKGPAGLWITANQGWLIWFWILVLGFALRIDGCLYCLRHSPRLLSERVALSLHICGLIVLPAMLIGVWPALLNYALWTACAGPYLAAVFYPNHIGVKGLEADATEPFLLRQLAATRNIAGGHLRNLLSGGLNHHIEHHLFPGIPCQHLTHAGAITRAFCHRHGLAYREQYWRQGIAEVLDQIRKMAGLARAIRQETAVPAWQDQA